MKKIEHKFLGAKKLSAPVIDRHIAIDEASQICGGHTVSMHLDAPSKKILVCTSHSVSRSAWRITNSNVKLPSCQQFFLLALSETEMGHPKDDVRGTTPRHRGVPKKSNLPNLGNALEDMVKTRSALIDFSDPENFRATELSKLTPGRTKVGHRLLGTLIDKYCETLVPNSEIPPGVKKQQRVYNTTGDLYIDAIDYDAGIIHEIKPHSS